MDYHNYQAVSIHLDGNSDNFHSLNISLKRLFQGTLSLEDFHTRALRLVTQAGYEGDAKDQALRDTIISGLASDKIRAKIVKEGHTVTLNQVMEIARLEVSTQHHLDRMQ